ncbi:MAG: L,D-transpeptidase family protein [Syntrophobacteraceae bacterium]|nr:L,D-transpeptidase family protein [Syntrophobacteraceae bacterium]MCU0588907.1 L,D-transpeptidase family protein [Syntrophobacteraceae bacterium]
MAVFLTGLAAHGGVVQAQTLAVVKNSPQARPEIAIDDSAKNPSEAASALWRAFIWEAIPPEWLTDSSKSTLLEAYQMHEWKPFFINARFELTDAAHQLKARMNQADEHALDPRIFTPEKLAALLQRLDQCRIALHNIDPQAADRLARFPEMGSQDFEEGAHNPMLPVKVAMESSQPLPAAQGGGIHSEAFYRDAFRAASEVDVLLTRGFLRYSDEMNPFAREERLQALAGQISLEDFVRGLAPAFPRYKALQIALKKYRKLAKEHPRQPRVTAASIRPGESGSHVRDLQLRLQQEGFFEGKATGSFDAQTHRAVEAFQQAHLLTADGVVGRSTMDWLNVPYAHKAEMISVSMKSMRESQTRRYDTYVRINIPQFTLEYIKDGKVKDVHRVIVGKASGKRVKMQGRVMGENQTPPLSSSIEQVVVNPRWFVTDRIWREIAGDASDDPDYFSRHGYVQMSSAYASGAPRVFQEPGPSNPLGQVKFEFPNAYAVFLHDTPKKYLFDRSRRDFSHGCIRVENAKKLAQTLLEDDANPASERFESLFKGKRPTHIRLNEPVPIVVEYMPVSSFDGHEVVFLNDVYGVFSEASLTRS